MADKPPRCAHVLHDPPNMSPGWICYCQLPKGHLGPHTNYDWSWTDKQDLVDKTTTPKQEGDTPMLTRTAKELQVLYKDYPIHASLAARHDEIKLMLSFYHYLLSESKEVAPVHNDDIIDVLAEGSLSTIRLLRSVIQYYGYDYSAFIQEIIALSEAKIPLYFTFLLREEERMKDELHK